MLLAALYKIAGQRGQAPSEASRYRAPSGPQQAFLGRAQQPAKNGGIRWINGLVNDNIVCIWVQKKMDILYGI